MGFKKEVVPILHETYSSPLIDWMKAHGFRLNVGRVTFFLAEEFGFCYGVDRAVQLAYETRMRFPEKRIFLTSEIIHNPQVNSKLKEHGIFFLDDPEWKESGLSAIKKEDVAIIPAFGTTVGDLEDLKKIGCILVDTTCGSVVHVWRRVEQYAQDGFTAIVHGKYDHEETRATCSRASQFENGKYLVVRDLEQTQLLCDFVLGKISKQDLMTKFENNAFAKGFAPETDLIRVGCANQTTMLSDDSRKIADLIRDAMIKRYGEESLAAHFRHFDTICSATQERQDAVLKLIKEGLQMMLVIGGYNSSNTGHLVEIASEHCATYHIQDASDIISGKDIRFQPPKRKKIEVKKNWLPAGALRIGLTAGASTPNRAIEEVIRRISILEGIEGNLPV